MKSPVLAVALLAALVAAAPRQSPPPDSPEVRLEAITSALNSIPAVIFIKDNAGVYRGGNTAWAELLGRPLPELLDGKTDFDLFPEEVAKSFRAFDKAMLAAGKPQRNRETLVYPDGHSVVVETLKAPWIAKDGTCAGLVGVCWPITTPAPAETR